mgnify:CR=1 FL=1
MAESTSSVQVPDPYRLELVTSDGSRSEAVDNVLRAVALGFHLSQPSDAELEHYAACVEGEQLWTCLLYTSDAADEEGRVDIGGGGDE